MSLKASVMLEIEHQRVEPVEFLPFCAQTAEYGE
jgi:hypothetical protein